MLVVLYAWVRLPGQRQLPVKLLVSFRLLFCMAGLLLRHLAAVHESEMLETVRARHHV